MSGRRTMVRARARIEVNPMETRYLIQALEWAIDPQFEADDPMNLAYFDLMAKVNAARKRMGLGEVRGL